MLDAKEIKICVVGLGYVGLPVAAAMSERYTTLGFDIDITRISELRFGFDRTLEIEDVAEKKNLQYSCDPNDIAKANVYIVTVPTPIDHKNSPDFSALISATTMIAKHLDQGNIVIYESTVYPGATEEVAVPILEQYSRLELNSGFGVGYSPERINPGDKERTFKDIIKITSGSNPQTAKFVNSLYAGVLNAETYMAPSIKVAEAAKVIENCQRDINIAFVNELSQIFNLMGIDTKEVLDAASTKWNFHRYSPGLVGGHCIGVDPYYLVEKARQLNHSSKVILSGRDMNEGMAGFVVNEIFKQQSEFNFKKEVLRVLILGGTFKENCPDFRNSKVSDLILELNNKSVVPDLHDPYCVAGKKENFPGEFHWIDIQDQNESLYDVILIAVPHKFYRDTGVTKIKKMGGPNVKLFDLKGLFPKNVSDFRL